MTRLGYAILAALVIALGVYVFRPTESATVEWVKVYAGTAPTDYEVIANGLHQQVAGKAVSVAGHRLPLAEQVAGGLWNQWTVLSAPADKVVRGVPAADLGAYGIDPGARRLWGAGFDLAWGTANGEGYAVDRLTGTVYSVGLDQARRLDQIASRLDTGNPMPAGVAFATVEAAGVRLVPRNGMWAAVGAPMRPDFRKRVEVLQRLALTIRIGDLQAALPADAEPVAELRYELDPEGAAMAGLPALYAVRLLRGGKQGGLVAVNDLPVQAIGADGLAAWTAAIAACGEDRLFNLGDAIAPNPAERVVVERGGKPWFSLVSTTAKDMDDFSSRWDVVWDGGREFAAPDSAQRLVDALNDLAVRDVRVRLALEPDWSDAVRITLLGKMVHGISQLELHGDQARSEAHVGTVARLGDLLGRLAPDRFLDTMIAGRSPERVMKIQRRFLDRQPAVEEVLTHDSRGGWSRTWPRGEPVGAVAVQRIARVIATGRALAARLAGPEDRAVAAAPEFEIAVRFGPKPAGKANDFTDLEDTTTNDLGLAMSRAGEGRWRALLVGTGTAYDLDDDLVQQLRQDVADPLVLPLVPALVRKAQLGAGASSFGLVRSGESWTVVEGEASAPAKAVEVRRLLRDLAALTAARRAPGGTLAPADTALAISLELPGFDREVERFLLQIGRPGAAGAAPGEVALYAESTRPGALESNRAYTAVANVAAFSADPARFK